MENATLRRAMEGQAPRVERITVPILSRIEHLRLEGSAADLVDALNQALALWSALAHFLDRRRDGHGATGPASHGEPWAADLLRATVSAEALIEEMRRAQTLWATAARVLELGRQMAAIGIELHGELTSPGEARG